MELALIAALSLISLAVLISVFVFLLKKTKVDTKTEEQNTTSRGTNSIERPRNNMRRRAQRRFVDEDDDSDDDGDSDNETFTKSTDFGEKRKGKKYEEKMARKREKKEIFENMLRERKEKEEREIVEQLAAERLEEKKREKEKKMKEELERIRKEKEEQERIEYENWKATFSIETKGSGQDDKEMLISKKKQICETIISKKVVTVEEIASEFGGKSSEIVELLKNCENEGVITGILDDRGKYIFITDDEMERIAKYVKVKGRLDLSEIVGECNRVVVLPQK